MQGFLQIRKERSRVSRPRSRFAKATLGRRGFGGQAGLSLHASGSSGFSLVEMLVSIGIFSLVMIVSVAAVVSMVNTNRYARAAKNVADNLAFAMESMSRNIKIGSSYNCGGWSGSSGTNDGTCGSISFKDFRNGTIRAYRLSNGAVEQSFGGQSGPITASEIVVENLTFTVTGSSNTDLVEPRVRINLKAYSEVGKSKVYYALQTTVSQRGLDEPQ